jgi:hypothetical protein
MLCLRCGSLKPQSPLSAGVPALLEPCDRCGSASSDATLEMKFSDATMPKEQLQFFASVFQAIRAATDDEVAVFWSFLRYVSSHYPQLLSRTVPGIHKKRVEAVYGRVQWPAPVGHTVGVSQPQDRRRWWQFWK